MADQYDKFIGLVRTQGAKYNPPQISLGKIISVVPLQLVNSDGMPLSDNNLYISKDLLEWDEIVNITTSTNGEPSHTHTVNTIHHPSKFNIGNSVILYPTEDNQKYIVLGVV